MNADNEVRLRLRFHRDVEENRDVVLQKFIQYRKNETKQCYMKIRNHHVFLDIVPEFRRIWSPQLHVELEPQEDNPEHTHARCLFGPDQTLWTFFMFLHFLVGGTFLLFSGLACSNYILKLPVMMNLVVLGLMVFVWFLLYVIAKQIREKGSYQMNELEFELDKILNS